MDTSNLKATESPSGADDDTTKESVEWRDQLQPYSRETIKNALADTLKRHLSFSGHEELQEIKQIVERVEEEIYNAATSQPEYHKMIFLNYSAMDTRLQQKNLTSDPGSHVMQQLKDLEQHVVIHVTSDNIQQMMPPSMHTNIDSIGSGLQQPPMTNVAGQALNWHNFQNMSTAQQNYLNFQLRLQQQSAMDQQMKLSSLLQQAQQLMQSQQIQQSQQLQHLQQLQQLNGQSLNMSGAYRNQQSQQLQQLNGQSYSNHNSFGYSGFMQQQLQHYRMQQQGLIGQQNRLSGPQQPSQQLIGQKLNLLNLQNMSTDQGMVQSNRMPTQQQNQQQMLLSSLQLSQQLIGQILNLQNLQNMSIDQGMVQSNKMPTQQQIQQSQQLPQQVMLPQMPAQVQQSQPQLPEMQSSQLGQLQP